MVPFGLLITLMVVIGRSIGEGNVVQAKRYKAFFQNLCFETALISAISMYLFLYYFKDFLY